MQAVDLDALVNPARQVGVSLGGVQYQVSPITWQNAQRIAVANESGNGIAVVEAMAASARESVPAMPPEVFAKLPMEAIAAIVAVSQHGVDAVERLIAERVAGK